jgi:hypothetical protein
VRNRWDDLIPVIKRYPNLLGIGISEDTAIVVRGDQFEVMGHSKVAIHDNTRRYQRRERPYYLLSAGDVYDMRTRQIVTNAEARDRPAASQSATTAGRMPVAEVFADHPRISAVSAPPSRSSRPAPPSATPTPGAPMARSNGSVGVPAPSPTKLPRLLERLLMVIGDGGTWSEIETIDVDGDGEIDLLRVHLINGDTIVWEIRR